MSLPVTTELIARTATSLADDGWRFTPRQLYYATCLAAETPPSRSSANGLMALGIILVLVGIILLHIPVAFVALLIAGGLFVVMGVIARLVQKPPTGRVLAVSYAEFQRLLSEAEPDGVIDVSAWRPASTTIDGVALVCDTEESAAAIAANSDKAKLAGAIVVAMSAQLKLSGKQVIALHDASPKGCALPLELRDTGAVVFDGGLRPQWVDGHGFQELEGAPARLPRDLTAVLNDAEIGWLASGRRVELAVLPPDRLARLVQTALENWKGDPDAPSAGAPGLLPSLPDLP